MDIVKVGLIGIAGVLLALQFKQTKPEYSYVIGFAICLTIFVISIAYLKEIIGQLDIFQQFLKENGRYYKLILKVIGITYVCEFCSGICNDAGYQAVGKQIEIFGKVVILFSGVPILFSLIEVMQEFMNR